MKVFDCFKFFNELELLHLRFMEYYNHVDYFVLVESNKSHTGKQKNLIFQENKHLFSEYLDKVIHVIVDDLPDYSIDNIWLAENFQRNAIRRGLIGLANAGDKILISDCDEFWNVDVFNQNKYKIGPFTFLQKLYYYWVNCQQNQIWNGTVCATYGNYGTEQDLRNLRGYDGQDKGGWHYSFMGGVDRIKTKVENIAESSVIINEVGDETLIAQRMANVEDLWGRTEELAQKRILTEEEFNSDKPKSMDKFLSIYPDFKRYI